MHPLLAMLLITLAGGATALQAPINARLATGVGSASSVSTAGRHGRRSSTD